jgi:hypothetical protein
MKQIEIDEEVFALSKQGLMNYFIFSYIIDWLRGRCSALAFFGGGQAVIYHKPKCF